mmetsp:Transcript_72758/g.128534  ORF Transcript_72758/g.128534 Transcript_72758/m.128534 type:complete len:107 (-) Transcript_72758:226-546(-)
MVAFVVALSFVALLNTGAFVVVLLLVASLEMVASVVALEVAYGAVVSVGQLGAAARVSPAPAASESARRLEVAFPRASQAEFQTHAKESGPAATNLPRELSRKPSP